MTNEHLCARYIPNAEAAEDMHF